MYEKMIKYYNHHYHFYYYHFFTDIFRLALFHLTIFIFQLAMYVIGLLQISEAPMHAKKICYQYKLIVPECVPGSLREYRALRPCMASQSIITTLFLANWLEIKGELGWEHSININTVTNQIFLSLSFILSFLSLLILVFTLLSLFISFSLSSIIQ